MHGPTFFDRTTMIGTVSEEQSKKAHKRLKTRDPATATVSPPRAHCRYIGHRTLSIVPPAHSVSLQSKRQNTPQLVTPPQTESNFTFYLRFEPTRQQRSEGYIHSMGRSQVSGFQVSRTSVKAQSRKSIFVSCHNNSLANHHEALQRCILSRLSDRSHSLMPSLS